MARFILTRITLLFMILLAVGVAGGVAYQMFYVAPAKKCEAQGRWWADKWRACATPVDLRRMPVPAFVTPPAASPPPKKP